MTTPDLLTLALLAVIVVGLVIVGFCCLIRDWRADRAERERITAFADEVLPIAGTHIDDPADYALLHERNDR